MLRSGTIPVRTSKGNTDVLARLKRLDRTQRHAVLAKTDRTGPLVSLVAMVLTKDRKGIVFATPSSTAKYRNMRKDRNDHLWQGVGDQGRAALGRRRCWDHVVGIIM